MPSSYYFDPAGREQYEAIMKAAGYVEVPQFKPHMNGYTCASCEYFRKLKQSPTGFWCTKNEGVKKPFPDRPQGCCDWWEPVPGLIKNGNRGKETQTVPS